MKKKLVVGITIVFLFVVLFFREVFNYFTATILLFAPSLIYIFYKTVILLKSVHFKIWWNKRSLKKQIKKNKKTIDQLEDKSEELTDRLNYAENVAEDIRIVLEKNLILWKRQISVHHDIIALLNLRIDRLDQHKTGISLLEYTIGQIKSEPDKAKLIRKLETLISKVDGKVDRDINSKIEKLMKDIALDDRDAKIVNMKKRLVVIKQKAII